MDKKEARKILGVTKEASRNDIERKYSILLKKHRMENERPAGRDEDAEAGEAGFEKETGEAAQKSIVSQDAGINRDAAATKDAAVTQDSASAQAGAEMQGEYSFEQITQAYNVLMGYEVTLKEEPPSKAAPLLKKAGIDEKKARNFFYYYKFHILGAILAVIALISIIRGCVNQEKPDFNIAFIGRISYSDATDKLRDGIKAAVPEIKVPGFDGAFIASDDQSEQQYAMTMKATVLFAAGEVDLFILDKENYLRYAKNGAFASLDDIAPKLGVDMEKNRDNIVATEETDPATGKVKITGDKHLYGIDISNSKALKDAGVLGREFFAAIHVNDKQTDKAVKVLQFLMK